MTTDDFTTAALAEARRAWEGDKCMMMPDLAVHMAEWARDHLAAQEPTDAESLLDTDAGLALANAAWQEGASTMLRSVNEHEDGPWEKPGSPYSAPLLARIAARRDEESR